MNKHFKHVPLGSVKWMGIVCSTSNNNKKSNLNENVISSDLQAILEISRGMTFYLHSFSLKCSFLPSLNNMEWNTVLS